MKQQMIHIEVPQLLDQVERMKRQGCRMVQICCTRVPEGYELTYSFDKDYTLYNLRLTAAENEPVMSITSIYWPAFVYENEMHDLFGVQIRHIAHDVDYGGTFYRLAEKTPWHELSPRCTIVQKAPPADKPAAAKQAGTAAEKSKGGESNG
ncbi:MAG: NADH-quinone oxidoreductase subunit C [Oscillospiraceae bacterium]|nr:NADH-quinone oxidoreductase subunit C [Oscillospiraceae bacterium]MDD3262105.1 NADH-quinone oxidoreductase subunit C [Oscillospiraceae bacterium]